MERTERPGYPLPYDDYRSAIERETELFAAVVADVDPGTEVPHCPGWTLADLVRHSGSVQRWFCVLLDRLVQEPPRSREVELGLPDRPEEYPDWLGGGASAVAAVLRATDPDAPMWAWGVDQHARFWARRMLFETLVHRIDAEHALGRPSLVDPVLAADGVDEFLANLPYAGPFAPGVLKLRGNDETLAFRCTDRAADDGWLVELRPDAFAARYAAGTAPQQASAAVQGTAADLLLFLYGRLTREHQGFQVSGDRELLDRWTAHSRF